VLYHNCGFFCTGVRQSPSNSDDLHGQVQQLTRQHFLAYLTVLEAKYVIHCTALHSPQFVLFFIIP
jgi:hypothetical protein